MPKQYYQVLLNDTAYVAVEFTTIKGNIVSFVVRLMIVQGDSDICVARYDTAHGSPHLDIVDGRGRLLEKKWLLDIGFADALSYAINDFKTNYADYIKKFQ